MDQLTADWYGTQHNRAGMWETFKRSDLGLIAYAAFEEIMKGNATSLRSEFFKRMAAQRVEFENSVEPLHVRAYELLARIHIEPENFSLRDELAEVDLQIIKNYIPAYDNSIGWGRLPVIARIHFNQLRRLQAQLLTYSFSVATRDARQRISYAPQMIEAALDKDDKIYDVLQATSRRWTWGEVYKGDDDRLYESLNQILHDPAYSAKDKEEIGFKLDMIRDQGKTDVKIRDLIEQFLDSGFEEEGETIVSVYEHILRLRTMMDFTEATNRRNDRLNAVYVENRVEQYIEHEITARMHSLFLGFIFSLPEFQQQIHGMISPNMFAHPLMALDTIQNAMHEANDRTNTVRNVNASYEERFAALGGVLSPRRDDQVDYCTYGQDEQRAMENLGDQIGRLSVKIDTARPGVMETPTRAEYHRCLRQNSYDSNGARSYNTATHSVETNQSFNSTAVSYEFGLGEPVTSKAASFAGNLETPKAPFYHGPVDEDDDTPKASKAFRPTAILQHKRNASSVENASPGKKVRMSKEIVPHKRNASKNASAGGSPKKALGYKEWSEMMGKAYGRGSHGTTTNDL